MVEMTILLDTIECVKAFVSKVSHYPDEMDICSGRYVIDAKSIMGIFSLDLSKPIDLNIHAENEASVNEILTVLAPYLIH